MAKAKERTRKWCVTTFSDTMSAQEWCEHVASKAATRYVVCGEEVAPTTGKRHLQAFVEFRNAATFEQVKDRLPLDSHVEASVGSLAQNRAYCTKGGNYYEIGEPFERIAVGDEAKAIALEVAMGVHPIAVLHKYPENAAFIVNHFKSLLEMYKEVLRLADTNARAEMRAAAHEEVDSQLSGGVSPSICEDESD